MSFPGFYKGKALIAQELNKWVSKYPNNEETYLAFCRRMRVMTGQGPNVINKILEEDYAGMKVINGELVRE